MSNHHGVIVHPNLWSNVVWSPHHHHHQKKKTNKKGRKQKMTKSFGQPTGCSYALY